MVRRHKTARSPKVDTGGIVDAETLALLTALRAKLEAKVCSLTLLELWERYFRAAAPELKDARQVADLMKAPLAALGGKRVDEFRRADWITYRAERSQQVTRF